MSDSDGWAQVATGHAAFSADGVVQHKKSGVSSPPPGPTGVSPVGKGREPPAINGGLTIRGYVGKLQAKARSAGRALVGAPRSPRLKHSTSDDMESFGGYGLGLANGLTPG